MSALVTIPEYTQTAKALAELEGRLKSVVYDVATTKGMEAARKDRKEVRDLRIALEAERVRIKAPALERSRLIDAEAKSLTAKLVDLESPIDAQIKAEEQRKENEKRAAEEAERQRIQAIHDRFNAIKALPLAAVGKTADEIRALIASAEHTDTTFTGQDAEANGAAAVYELRLALSALRAALDARLVADAEAAKVAAERAELEELREQNARLEREQERLRAAQREQEAEEARKAEEAARAQREAEEAAERARIKAEQDEADRLRQERQAAEDAERAAVKEQLRVKAQKVADDQAALEREKKRLKKEAEQAAIAGATLKEAAQEALELLEDGLGQAGHLVCLKLRAALGRTP